jgi:hypothetical protein
MAREKDTVALITERRIVDKSLHSHAFWLYSTVVALAIKEALAETIPYFITPPANPVFDRVVYGFRLLVFLVVVIRFYLGSAIFFERAHAGETADKDFPNKSYVIDFVFGLVHFLLFFAWAFSIDINTKPITLFPVLLGVILLYDIPWLIASISFDPLKLMKLWAAINFGATLAGLLVYLAVLHFFTSRTPEEAYRTAEEAAYILVIFISILDIWELIGKKEIFRKLFGWFLR